jgi:hypothetical protein
MRDTPTKRRKEGNGLRRIERRMSYSPPILSRRITTSKWLAPWWHCSFSSMAQTSAATTGGSFSDREKYQPAPLSDMWIKILFKQPRKKREHRPENHSHTSRYTSIRLGWRTALPGGKIMPGELIEKFCNGHCAWFFESTIEEEQDLKCNYAPGFSFFI